MFHEFIYEFGCTKVPDAVIDTARPPSGSSKVSSLHEKRQLVTALSAGPRLLCRVSEFKFLPTSANP